MPSIPLPEPDAIDRAVSWVQSNGHFLVAALVMALYIGYSAFLKSSSVIKMMRARRQR